MIKDKVKKVVILTQEIFGCITLVYFHLPAAAQVLGLSLSKLLSSDLRGSPLYSPEATS